MFGKILYQGTDGYAEYLLADENGVMVIACMQPGYTGMRVKLYRVEWTEADGYRAHMAVYNLQDAILVFKAQTNRLAAEAEAGRTNQ